MVWFCMRRIVMEDKKVFDKKENVVNHINDNLKDYEGYVQFSDTPLRKCDVFEGYQDIKLTPTKGFVYEAHFSNGNESIMIRQQNAEWVVSTIDISKVENEDMNYYALEKTFHLKDVKSNWVKMAQIWEAKADELCERMEVMKLQKVVFAGFAVNNKKGEES